VRASSSPADDPASPDAPRLIEHAEALRLIDGLIGEEVRLSVGSTPPGAPLGRDEVVPFVDKRARLRNPAAPRPPRLEPDVGLYALGERPWECFPFGPGMRRIELRDQGLDVEVAEGIFARLAWSGSADLDGPREGADPAGQARSV
jgi:hypothetical protein